MSLNPDVSQGVTSMISYDCDEVAEMLTSKFPVYLDTDEAVLTIRRNRDDITVARLYHDSVAISWPEICQEPLVLPYDDPDFEDKVVKRMHLRLYGTEEDYLRFKRQEEVKRYFEQKKEEESCRSKKRSLC